MASASRLSASGGPSRRVVLAGAWSTPALLLATATPALATSPGRLRALIVRAGSGDWTPWQGLSGLAPGIRFVNSATTTLTAVATITFTPSGGAQVPNAASIFTIYDALVVTGPTVSGVSLVFTVSVTLGAGQSKGITIRNVAAANGSYLVSIDGGLSSVAVRDAESGARQAITPAP